MTTPTTYVNDYRTSAAGNRTIDMGNATYSATPRDLDCLVLEEDGTTFTADRNLVLPDAVPGGAYQRLIYNNNAGAHDILVHNVSESGVVINVAQGDMTMILVMPGVGCIALYTLTP